MQQENRDKNMEYEIDTSSPAGQEHLLILSREPQNLSRLLDRHGYWVQFADNNEEALLKLSQRPTSLVLMDLLPSAEEGLALLQQLRSSHGLLQLPILVVSGHTDSQTIVKAHDLGANDFVAVPYDPDILLAKVRRQLACRRLCPEAPVFPIGSHLGSYELLELLGEGAMGRVLRARDLRTGREVALKVLLSGRLPQLRERFANEARAATRIQHPNVVAIYEVGEQPVPYIAMECVAGRNLDDPGLAGPMPVERACQTLLAILEAVKAIHHERILHRDLKPGNIMITHDGQVKLLDFGVAKLLDDPKRRLTETGLALGTPQYMAPEQIDSSFGAVSERSDLFAVAGIFYRLLTGSDPFPAGNPTQQMFAITTREPVPPRQLQPDLPSQLESICLLGLLKAPGLRFQSADEFASVIRDYLQETAQVSE